MRYALIGLLAVLVIPSFALAGDRYHGGNSSNSGFSVSVGIGSRSGWGSHRDSGYGDSSIRYSSYRYGHQNGYDRGGRYDNDFRRDFYRPAPAYHPAPVYYPAPAYCPPPAYVYRPTVHHYGPVGSHGWGHR